ncbi:tyrosine-type recombinase/integrase [Paraburkholderia youngii]|uniref:Tyrosine-type recombinase/integrase n=1 Tax=Paraburkholderia youngii TaxID=2782701 RepID=A0A7Y6K846_9BURK|nr:tyrosine-type recombinase/integrase [Paraburkholderia youngii]NUY06176.1 tyrosine-type recombinase/integrase [Paraburkholderia youngii]
MTAIRDSLTRYVAVRRALGASFYEPALALGHFVDLLEHEGAEFITIDLALRWATTPVSVERATWGRRLSAVRGFARWMNTVDGRNEIPPAGLLSARRRRNAPHIYTEQEINLLMIRAAQLRSRTGMRALTYSTLIGLLVATGLRPGEALRLDRSDVDLVSGILSIRESKFGKSRFVPVEESTRAALERYAQSRDRLCPQRLSEAFLVGERGVRLKAGTVRSMFVRMSRAVGLRPATEDGRDGYGPRLQDFRHSFATGRMVEWYRAESDVNRQLPKLAAYLGHVNIGLTYWYIEAVPELLELAAGYLGRNPPGDQS